MSSKEQQGSNTSRRKRSTMYSRYWSMRMRYESQSAEKIPEQELATLVALTASGDKRAAEILVLACEGIIQRNVDALTRYKRRLDREELMQEGRIGVIEAAKSHDPNKGSFLYWLQFHLKIANDLRTPNSGRRIISLPYNYGKPSHTHHVDKKAVRATRRMLSIEADNIDLDAEMAEVTPQTETEDVYYDCERRTMLRREMMQLRPQEQIVMALRCYGEDEYTLKEIGDLFGVSRERIRQIEENVLLRVKNNLMANAKTMRFNWHKSPADLRKELFGELPVAYAEEVASVVAKPKTTHVAVVASKPEASPVLSIATVQSKPAPVATVLEPPEKAPAPIDDRASRVAKAVAYANRLFVVSLGIEWGERALKANLAQVQGWPWGMAVRAHHDALEK